MLNKNLRIIREIRGYSQDYIANQLGISQNAYSKLERGETGIDEKKLEQISKVLNVSSETIKNFSEAIVFNNSHCNNGVGNYANYIVNPLEKIVELYENIIRLKDEEIVSLKKKN